MMNRAVFSKIVPLFKNKFTTHCDDSEESQDLMAQADSLLEDKKQRLSTPVQFENLKNIIGQGSVSTYDGFRLIVQKQLNLNTVVSHFFWIGSSQTPHPIYQYRLILPFDEKVVNVASDLDFNVEGEVKFPISSKIFAKTNFVIGEQQTTFAAEVEGTTETTASQLKYSRADNAVTVSHMQTVYPNVMLGASGQISLKTMSMTSSYGGMATVGDNTLAYQWDDKFQLMYMRKVNPNRVHLTTDLTVEKSGKSEMSVGAEFMLKQSKVHIGVDSGLLIRSSVDSEVSPGVTLQYAAEMQQNQGHYKFGFGIIMS